MDKDIEQHPAFDEFVSTIAALRAPGGCPWDREQTHLSIAPNMIEEAYEAVDAIEHNDIQHLREELGDVLLQVVLQSQIAADDGEFTIDDVCADINAKMIRRHPHVFGNSTATNANEVLGLWEQVKLQENAGSDKKESLLASVPAGLPALTQAQKISRKAVACGFEWESLDDVWAKVDEEITELKVAYSQAAKDENGKLLHNEESATNVELELGDVLFTIVNVARKMGINAESALRATCTKFRTRWEAMEALGLNANMSTAEMNELWEKAKSAED